MAMIIFNRTVQQLIAQVALYKPRQMAIVAPVILFDKLQKDNPGGVHRVLAQRVTHARVMRLFDNQRRENSAELIYRFCIFSLSGGDNGFQLVGSEAFALCVFWFLIDVCYNLSVAVKVLRMTEFCAVLHQA